MNVLNTFPANYFEVLNVCVSFIVCALCLGFRYVLCIWVVFFVIGKIQ